MLVNKTTLDMMYFNFNFNYILLIIYGFINDLVIWGFGVLGRPRTLFFSLDSNSDVHREPNIICRAIADLTGPSACSA